MRIDSSIPKTRKAAKAVHVLRAMFAAKPNKEVKAARRAAREFDRLHPKPRKAKCAKRSFA